jgi:hypothetical protein
MESCVFIEELNLTLARNKSIPPRKLIIHIPSRKEVEGLEVGDRVLDCFGKFREVTSVHARGEDIHGKAYACFYTEFGEGAHMSGSIKEDELVRTVGLSHYFTSWDLDDIEEELLKRR